MLKKKNNTVRLNHFTIDIVIENIIWLFVILTTFFGVLNIIGITKFNTLFMKPTYLGITLFFCLLYETKNVCKVELFPSTSRIILTGVIVSNIFITGDLKLFLLFLFALGLAIADGTFEYFLDYNIAYFVITLGIMLEIYSILLLFFHESSKNSWESFWVSWQFDFILIVCFSIYVLKEKITFPVLKNKLVKKEKNNLQKIIGLFISIIVASLYIFFYAVTHLFSESTLLMQSNIYASESIRSIAIQYEDIFKTTTLIRDAISFLGTGAIIIFISVCCIFLWLVFMAFHRHKMIYIMGLILYCYSLIYASFSSIVTLLVIMTLLWKTDVEE